MGSKRNRRTRLKRSDFAGDGDPYSEVIVTISIRILGSGITRSRLAVNIYADPALEVMGKKLLSSQGKKCYGHNDRREFVACLCKNVNGWEDMNSDYPRISENHPDFLRRDGAKKMNSYVKESVDWAIGLHSQAMMEVQKDEAHGISDEPEKR